MGKLVLLQQYVKRSIAVSDAAWVAKRRCCQGGNIIAYLSFRTDVRNLKNGDEESQQYREMGDLSHSSPLGGELRFEMTCTRMNSLRCTTRDLLLQRLSKISSLCSFK